MSRPLRALVLRILLLAVTVSLAVVGAAGSVHAQSPANLRVLYNVDKTGPTHVELSGRVYNDGSADVADVYVSAEAVDGAGKVVAQGIPYVGSVRARGSAPFKARVPVVRGATGFQVGINSFRFTLGRSEAP